MNQRWIPLRSPCCNPVLSPTLAVWGRRGRPPLRIPPAAATSSSGPSTSNVENARLTARERRQLRNERRERLAAAAGSWREEVEERLSRRPKKRDKASWKEELNLDNLSLLGPQWWVVRVSRVTGQDTAERLARVLARNYPDRDFKVYFPALRVKKKLKNGSYSSKSNPLFPGCVFLYCVLNKELHDFVRECDGVGGFLGSKVGNNKRQINKPKPVAADEMEAIFHQAKEAQEKYDQSFEEEQVDGSFNKVSEATETRSSSEKDHSILVPGSSVRVLSGPFMDYIGCLKQLDHKAGKATIGILVFGKETFFEVEANEIVPETT